MTSQSYVLSPDQTLPETAPRVVVKPLPIPASAISLEQARTLYGLFVERVRRTPERIAYRQFDAGDKTWKDSTWREMAGRVGRWQAALAAEGLKAGDRVAVMMRNSKSWATFDTAAQGLGLVVVPLYTNDRPDNVAYCLKDAAVRLLLIEGEVQWKHLRDALHEVPDLQRIVHLQPLKSEADARTRLEADWLAGVETAELVKPVGDSDDLATIVYTSGTTGRPKGVMLSHRNMLWDAQAALQVLFPNQDDVFLSFLPLSHTLERTAGYYLPMMTGTTVVYSRSVAQLGEDLKTQRPTVMISVPRVFELLYARIHDQVAGRSRLERTVFGLTVKAGWHRFQRLQGRAKWHPLQLLWPVLEKRVASPIMQRLGGRMRLTVSGGAALSPEVAQLFIGLGLPLMQGYGLTEHSPVISVNTLESNDPDSVGLPLPGVEVRFGDNHELQVRSPAITPGYWNNPEATAELIDAEGWLRTGDQARLTGGHLHITGRIKDILVLSNGEKVPPGDMEMAITLDPLFDQALVVGEGQPFLGALLNLNPEHWAVFANKHGLDPKDPAALQDSKIKRQLTRLIGKHTRGFPGYAQIRGVALMMQPWSVENGLMTPTLKLRRNRILERHRKEVDSIYAGR